MTRRPLAFVDLDDTLFATRRKQTGLDLLPVATTPSGSAGSFMSPRQQSFWNWLTAGAEVIPVTARTTASFARVSLKFSNFAVCTSGAVILQPDGAADPEWQAVVDEMLARHPPNAWKPQLAHIATRYPHSVEPIREAGRTVLFRFRAPDRHPAMLAQIAADASAVVPDAWEVVRTNHDVVIGLRACGKRRAVAWLLENRLDSPVFTLGIGDSVADLDFMLDCDYFLSPRTAQWIAESRVE